MFDRLKKLFGTVQENPVVQQVTTQVQQGVDAVQTTAQQVVEQAKDIHTEVMKDGKIDMNDLTIVKDKATNLAGSVNEMATDAMQGAKEIVADVKDAHAAVMADGKVTMDDLGSIKNAAQEIVTDAKDIAKDIVTPNTPSAV